MEAPGDILKFAPDGKLEMLRLAGVPNLLVEWDREIDLGGKSFRPAGWDECFPTIDPIPESPVMGELVGIPPIVHWQATSVEQIWSNPRFKARRRFSMKSSACMVVSFQVTNRHNSPLEFLRASHALVGVDSLVKARLSNGFTLTDFERNGSESKQFIANTKEIELFYPDFLVRLTSDQSWWGIWLNRGGWPKQDTKSLICLIGISNRHRT